MMSLIRSAVMRLTLFYLAILTLICVSFSVVVYDLSAREIDRSAPAQVLQRLGGLFPGDYERRWLDALDESRARLKQRLIITNVVIIVLGAVGSYWFARRTLQPIDESVERQGRFISDASHELRTPLTAIQTETEVGLRDPKLTLKEAKALLASNLEEAKRLSALTSSLLELSSGQQTLQLEPVQLSEVLTRALAQVEPARANADAKLTTTVANEAVLGSAPQLEELFVILLDNAIKYSPSGAQVSVAAKQQGRQVTITVRDTGVGIAAHDLPHIFDRFYRADTSRSKRHIDGHGLGLSIAQQIVDTHNGHIAATSKPGKGTTFVVRLLAA